jgi:hypothetical protein
LHDESRVSRFVHKKFSDRLKARKRGTITFHRTICGLESLEVSQQFRATISHATSEEQSVYPEKALTGRCCVNFTNTCVSDAMDAGPDQAVSDNFDNASFSELFITIPIELRLEIMYYSRYPSNLIAQFAFNGAFCSLS